MVLTPDGVFLHVRYHSTALGCPGYYLTFFNLPRPATATATAATATA